MQSGIIDMPEDEDDDIAGLPAMSNEFIASLKDNRGMVEGPQAIASPKTEHSVNQENVFYA